MNSPLANLEPKLLWSHFDAIRRTPRPSKQEEKIIALLKAWAEENGFDVRQDAAGTLAIKVPATPGHESSPTVILQNHMDMVCEKNADVDHDFLTEGIKVRVDGDWVAAEGTTLGADKASASRQLWRSPRIRRSCTVLSRSCARWTKRPV